MRRDALVEPRAAGDDERAHARLDLARFYLARGFYHEARAFSTSHCPTQSRALGIRALLLHAVASS